MRNDHEIADHGYFLTRVGLRAPRLGVAGNEFWRGGIPGGWPPTKSVRGTDTFFARPTLVKAGGQRRNAGTRTR